jgi:hypothetical protein
MPLRSQRRGVDKSVFSHAIVFQPDKHKIEIFFKLILGYEEITCFVL